MSSPAQQSSSSRPRRLIALISEVVQRRRTGEILSDSKVISAHPDLMPELAEQLRALVLLDGALDRIAQDQTATVDAPRSSGGTHAGAGLPEDSFAGYQLLREIHRGGQGVVYQALQKSTNRKVAIKVMKEGPFAGAADKARFEREVQILGQLQHPNIVGVHDSGSVGNNFYFVMDYIPGQPLDVYMAGAAEKETGTKGSKNQARVGLSIESTLKLFAKICEAVNAAHLRGIIHRDLKPGNIRVDPSGEPHILDFGLAKVSAFDPIGDGSPAMTITGQFIGSLPWASPEQAEGQPSKIDVRTDVYSLGVILYQMLTGKFPYEVIGNMRDVLDRILRAEPAKPSTVRKQINDEVETIVLKCLSKERERRYQTAGELARDISHYLAGEPVEAKRDSVVYVLRKTLIRYRGLVSAACAVVLVTVAAVITLGFMYSAQFRLRMAADEQRAIAAKERDHARAETAKYEAVDAFLHRMLTSAILEVESPKLRVADLLDVAAEQLPGDFATQPEVEAAARTSLGLSYRSLGRFDQAERELRKALAIRTAALGAQHADTIVSQINLVTLTYDRGKWADAEAPLREALNLSRHIMGPGDEHTLGVANNLAMTLQRQRKFPEAEALYREYMTQIDLDAAAPKAIWLLTANNFASYLVVRRKLDEARTILDALEPAAVRTLPKNDPLRAKILANRAGWHLRRGDLAASEECLRRATDLAAQIYTEAQPDRIVLDDELARVLAERGKFDQAVALLEHMLTLVNEHKRAAQPEALLARIDLAAAQTLSGRLDAAAQSLPALLERSRNLLGENNTITLKAAFELVNVRLAQQKLEAAEALSRDTLERRQQETVYGPQHPETLRSVHQLGRVFAAREQWESAEAEYRTAASIAAEVLPADHYLTGIFCADLGVAHLHLQRLEDAERELSDAARVLEHALGAAHPSTQRALSALLELYDRAGRAAEAESWREKVRPTDTRSSEVPAPP